MRTRRASGVAALLAGAALVGRGLLGCSEHGGAAQAPDAAVLDGVDGEPGRAAGTTAAPTDSGSPGLVAESPTLFEPEHVLQVEIELDTTDWDALRYEGRALSELFSGCAGQYDYTSYIARVTVDGESVSDVAIRKKGLLGSLSAARPSLKLDFDDHVPMQRVLGTKRMTLNNDRQDPSHAHQCVAYGAFAAAGVPASRCNFAHVVVNGQDLGMYTHVEEIKKPMLRRHFADDSGRLFEGQGSDFADGFIDRFDFKNDGEPDDRSALRAVADALLVPDDSLMQRLDAVLPLDAFYDFWAMESLLGHWDGYSGDLNNFYVYEAPGEGLRFLPWGTDGAFSREHPFLPDDIPQSVLAWARVPNRLLAHPDGHRRYVQTLQGLLETVWDEAALRSEVDAIAARIGSAANATSLDDTRTFLSGRRAELQRELDAGGPRWNVPPRNASACDDRSTLVTATFDTTWGALDSPDVSAGNALQVELAGSIATFAAVAARAGTFTEPGKSQPAVRVIGARADGSVVVAQISFGPAPFAAGTTRLHGIETVGFVAVGTPPDVRGIGLIGDGTITLEQAATSDGGAVRGRFEGRFVPLALSAPEP